MEEFIYIINMVFLTSSGKCSSKLLVGEEAYLPRYSQPLLISNTTIFISIAGMFFYGFFIFEWYIPILSIVASYSIGGFIATFQFAYLGNKGYAPGLFLFQNIFIICITILLLSSFLIYSEEETGTLFDESKYFGERENGVPQGQGTYTWSDGEKYEGEWKDGQAHGLGTNIFSNGDKYVGEFKDGKKNGQGTYTYPDGKKYVGEFKDGKFDGHGTLNWSNGDKYVGEYKEGKKWNGTGYNKDGEIIVRFVNGKQTKP